MLIFFRILNFGIRIPIPQFFSSRIRKKQTTGIFRIKNRIGILLLMGVPEIGTKNWNSQPRVEKQSKKLKAKGKGGAAPSKAMCNPKHKVSGGPTGQVPKKGCSEKFCQHCKAHGGPFQTHNTLDCRGYDSNGKPLEAAAGKPSESKKPYKKSGGNKGMAFMQSMFEPYV
jgi:hypothetical protein